MKTVNRAYSYDDVLLVPRRSNVKSRLDVDLSVQVGTVKLEYPIMSASMDTITNGDMAYALGELGCMGIVHRFQDIEERYEQASQCVFKGLPVGVAVGLHDDMEKIKRLEEVCSVISVDVAHAHSDEVLAFVKKLDDVLSSDCQLMVGNIVTYEAAKDLVNAGADIIKVGIGSGSVCTTRIVTGFGVPSITAIAEVRRAVEESNYSSTLVVADGGIRSSGDIAKALAAGADLVMLGSLLAGTEETPGAIVEEPPMFKGLKPTKHKAFRGMSTHIVRTERQNMPYRAAEGIISHVPYIGPVEHVINELMFGLRSALSYGGATTLSEFYANTEFIEISGASLVESHPHILNKKNVTREG